MSPLARTNLIMLGILVIQLIVIIALPKEGEVTATSKSDANVAGRQPYAGLELKDVRSVTITSGDGKVIQLAGKPGKEGEKDVTTWALASRDDFPSRASDVEKIVDAAKKIKLSRVITRQEKRYARLNVADGVTHARVNVAGDGGRRLADFRIGESSDFNSIHIRMEDDPAVYEAAGVSTWEFPTSVSGLVDTGFLDLPADQIVKVKLTSGTETFEIEKVVPESRAASAPVESRESETGPTTSRTAAETKPEPKWMTTSLDHQTLDKTKVESWIRGLARINLSDPIGKARKPEYGFDKPTATATLTMADGKETVLTVGAERKEERDYYLTATGKDYIVTVPAWNVTDGFQKKLKDLLPGSTPTPEEPPHDHEHR